MQVPSGTTAFVFTVGRTGDVSGASSVDFATANGSADAGTDYVSTSGSLNFLATETTKTITVQVSGDADVELDENFYIDLSGAVGATMLDKCWIAIPEDHSVSVISSITPARTSGAGGDRTHDPGIMSPLLSPLSYRPETLLEGHFGRKACHSSAPRWPTRQPTNRPIINRARCSGSCTRLEGITLRRRLPERTADVMVPQVRPLR